jgi:hypothetical protein
MNMKSIILKVVLTALISASPEYAQPSDSNHISRWVRGVISNNDKLLCSKVIHQDQFFVASHSSLLKVGYLIDVTGKSSTPKTFIISWRFLNKRGDSVESDVMQKDLKQDYISTGGRIYAEGVSYRKLDAIKRERVLVLIQLGKYANESKAPNSPVEFESSVGLKNIHLCEIYPSTEVSTSSGANNPLTAPAG